MIRRVPVTWSNDHGGANRARYSVDKCTTNRLATEHIDMGNDIVNPIASHSKGRRPPIDDRRREIARTAAELFDSAGYPRTTMEDIAKAVGVGKSTLYHYFSSKDEILFWIHEEFIDHLIGRHEKRLEAQLTPGVLLLEVMADILELMQTHRGHVRVFFEHHRELPSERRDSILVKRRHYEAMVEDIFVNGMKSGEFRDTDPKLISLAMFGMCNWAYQWYRAQGSLRTRDIAYLFWGYLVHGVASGAPGSSPDFA